MTRNKIFKTEFSRVLTEVQVPVQYSPSVKSKPRPEAYCRAKMVLTEEYHYSPKGMQNGQT